MATLVMLVLVCVLILTVGAAALFWAAWRRADHLNGALARRLEAEAQIEVATMQTLAAMRQAARNYSRQNRG